MKTETNFLVNAVKDWADEQGLNTDTPENFKEARELYRKAINKETATTYKTPECKKVLQLMDKDYTYEQALKKVLSENTYVSKTTLETELNKYI